MTLTLQEKLEQITKGLPPSPPYVPPKPAAKIPDRTVRAPGENEDQFLEGKNPGTGGGSIASPLTEMGRTYHPKKVFFSSDGVTYMEQEYSKDVSFTDAKNNPLVIKFKDQS